MTEQTNTQRAYAATVVDPATHIDLSIRAAAIRAAAMIDAGQPLEEVQAYLLIRTIRLTAVAGQLPRHHRDHRLPTLEEAHARFLDTLTVHTAGLGGHR